MSKETSLECCCCGGDAGRFEQWWNRDTGYGICTGCVADEIKRGTPSDVIEDHYGKPGINYAEPAFVIDVIHRAPVPVEMITVDVALPATIGHYNGPVKAGNTSDSIVTLDVFSGHDETAVYYGGHLIAESMATDNRRRVVALWNMAQNISTDAAEQTTPETLDGMLERASKYDAIAKDVSEWVCDKCIKAYAGPPSTGTACVICPSCGGTTMPRATYKIREANEWRDKHRTAEMLWEQTMMALVGEDGIGSVTTAITKIKSDLKAAQQGSIEAEGREEIASQQLASMERLVRAVGDPEKLALIVQQHASMLTILKRLKAANIKSVADVESIINQIEEAQ